MGVFLGKELNFYVSRGIEVVFISGTMQLTNDDPSPPPTSQRVHVITFVFVPLIAASIFYASNGENHIPFIDCLFVCVSAMTVTGLVTINVSSATIWQQVILFILMLCGGLSFVSVVMIVVRRHFFRVRFDAVIKSNAQARKRAHDVEEAHHLERRKEMIRLRQMLGFKSKHDGSPSGSEDRDLHSTSTSSTDRQAEAEIRAENKLKEAKKQQRKKKGPIRADMIIRTDQPAVLINPMGMPSSGHPAPAEMTQAGSASGGILNNPETSANTGSSGSGSQQIRISLPALAPTQSRGRLHPQAVPQDQPINEELPTPTESSQRYFADASPPRTTITEEETNPVDEEDPRRSRSRPEDTPKTTRFQDIPESPRLRKRRPSDPTAIGSATRRGSEPALHPVQNGLLTAQRGNGAEDRFPRSQTVEFADPPRQDRGYTTGVTPHTATGASGGGVPRQRTFDRTYTNVSSYRGIPLTRTATSAKDRGFGGFPTPLELAGQGLRRAFPKARERFMTSTTMPRTSTIASTHSFNRTATEGKAAPYLSFDLTVTGNSMFQSLTEAQRDELGGVEYRALDLLAKIVPAYWLGTQLFCFTICAPYIASRAYDKYRPVFESQGQYEPNTTWFWLFQVVSGYSNTGMSLIDTSMIQMADAYFPLIVTAFLILVGNTALAIFLRFWIWIGSKCVPKTSKSYETLRFILDHPRRCFIYLFPSGQTWFLLFILAVLNCIDWVAFEVLDIGNPVLEAIPVPRRIFDGLFQSIAVRAAGFQVVSLLTLAPAVQFLYVVMMYISAYPLALSVRSTNVYEERSLGVWGEKPQETEEDLPEANSTRGWGTYVAAHARRQLAFDIWWLGFALWLVCIIERDNIEDADSNGWFTVFSCLFELTSAYGTVGLSTGTPFDNFSLSGRFSTLGKLVVCATMIRGRHRGLPVAIDRSILLPNELEEQDAATEAWSQVDPLERTRSMDVGRTATGDFGTVNSKGWDRGAVNGDASAAVPTYEASTGEGLSRDRSRSRTPPTSPATWYHPHQHRQSIPPSDAFHLDAIQEKEGASTPLDDAPPPTVRRPGYIVGQGHKSQRGGAGLQLMSYPNVGEAADEDSATDSSSSGSRKGKEKSGESIDPLQSEQRVRDAEAEMEKRYGSSAAELTDSSHPRGEHSAKQ